MSRLRQTDLTDSDAAASQVGALCWRVTGAGLQVLMVTSRDTGRWVIPKGWPMPGRAPHEAAAREAWEEAGVTGGAEPAVIGTYGYDKLMGDGRAVPCVVAVYAVAVRKLAGAFPEKKQRKRRWMSAAEAAAAVQEPALSALIRDFAPPGSPQA
jgi:8-oxo-dGTP pyrophosphatase MutT (NUDIX family)